MTVNVDAINEVVKQIEDHRKAFNMWTWVRNNADHQDFIDLYGDEAFVIQPENIDEAATQCGTTLCIAGFALIGAGHKVSYKIKHGRFGTYFDQMFIRPDGFATSLEPDWVGEGAEIFGLPEVYASRLFHFTADNEVALEALKALGQGVAPEDIEILMDESDHCSCSTCDFPEEDEDYCPCGCNDE